MSKAWLGRIRASRECPTEELADAVEIPTPLRRTRKQAPPVCLASTTLVRPGVIVAEQMAAVANHSEGERLQRKLDAEGPD
jgi:hypothetical protein